jgi:GAF domain-containing protein
MTTRLPDDDRTEVMRARERIATLISFGAPLRQTLDELVRLVESRSRAGMLASILVLDEDGRHLRHGGAPSLPEAYNAAIDGIEIGSSVGSCGTAAFENRTVVVFDIENDRLWADYKDLALRHGLRACWSTPIHDAGGKVLGTFANYYPVVRDPSPVDRELTELVTRTAARAIEQQRKAAASPVAASGARS